VAQRLGLFVRRSATALRCGYVCARFFFLCSARLLPPRYSPFSSRMNCFFLFLILFLFPHLSLCVEVPVYICARIYFFFFVFHGVFLLHPVLLHPLRSRRMALYGRRPCVRCVRRSAVAANREMCTHIRFKLPFPLASCDVCASLVVFAFFFSVLFWGVVRPPRRARASVRTPKQKKNRKKNHKSLRCDCDESLPYREGSYMLRLCICPFRMNSFFCLFFFFIVYL